MGPPYPTMREISLRFSREYERRLTYVSRRHGRENTSSRERTSPPWVESHVSAVRRSSRLYGLSVQDAIHNAVISGKAAAQRRATCDNEDCGGERHAWDETVDYSAPLREHSRVTWTTLVCTCSRDHVISVILLKCIGQFSIFRRSIVRGGWKRTYSEKEWPDK